jgi:hypothetical protein
LSSSVESGPKKNPGHVAGCHGLLLAWRGQETDRSSLSVSESLRYAIGDFFSSLLELDQFKARLSLVQGQSSSFVVLDLYSSSSFPVAHQIPSWVIGASASEI